MRRNLYRNRRDAGRWLAEALSDVQPHRTVTIGVGGGGTAVAWEVASRLHTALDTMVLANIPVTDDPARVIGVLGPDGARWLDLDLLDRLRLTPADLRASEAQARAEREKRQAIYHEVGGRVPLHGRTALLVHDGLAGAAATRVAIAAARSAGASDVIVAAPVGDPLVCRELAEACERLECPLQPRWFASPGQFYDDFGHVPDATVRRMLAASRSTAPTEHPHP